MLHSYSLLPRARLAPMESAFIMGGHDFLLKFLDSWPAHLVCILNRLSFLLSRAILYYTSVRWNAKELLSMWVNPVQHFFDAIGETDSIVCGSAVCDFFRRVQPSYRNLDIIAGPDGINRISTILRLDSYMPGIEIREERIDREDRYSSGGRSYQVVVRTFVFQRVLHSWQKVSVHLVHGDPLEFLLACGSSGYLPSYRRIVC